MLPGVEATPTGLHWSVLVNCGIALLFLAMFYLESTKDCKLICTVVLLASEILIIFILGDRLDAAFLFMHTLCVSILGAAISFRGLIATGSSAEEDDCKQLQDKLDVVS
jgi:hypothetical protein